MEGDKIGRWAVTDEYIVTPNNERKWLCRCECGTERYVLERSLNCGSSLSCGCSRREKKSRDLTGMVFGKLQVLRRAEIQRKNGGAWWTCQCSCGKTVDFPATLLLTKKRISCGCRNNKKYCSKDISNQTFNSITALYPTERRDNKGNVVWHCICNECGMYIDLSYNELVYTNRKSCGCKKKEHNAKLPGLLTHVAGTSIDMIRSQKLPSNNTTGHKGVYWIKGKYTAKIVFQKKAYYLGSYERFEDAVAARTSAEEVLLKSTVEHYERWNKKAEENPRWAAENPIEIKVYRGKNSEIAAEFLPVI